GGASLSAVLKTLVDTSDPPSQGEQLVSSLKGAEAPGRDAAATLGKPSPTPAEEKTLTLLSGYSYVRALVWIVARLAEGLEHSHQRGVLHRDVKPANVLLTGDGQPMLLDFNLSQVRGDEGARATLGGTIAYMAPEHLRALAARDPAWHA